jgi:hypothetical protein
MVEAKKMPCVSDLQQKPKRKPPRRNVEFNVAIDQRDPAFDPFLTSKFVPRSFCCNHQLAPKRMVTFQQSSELGTLNTL